jgi:hypothetical protein
VQRLIPSTVRASAFGALEGTVSLTFGLGSLVSAALVTLVGLGPSLVAAGLLLPALALVTRPLVRRADHAAVVPERELELLGRVPLFAPLSMVVLEHLALSMEPVTYPAGAAIVEQGAAGDAYYVVAAGRADVVIDGTTVATLGPGDGFGEIALLDDRPRTATVIAGEPLDAYRLRRADFLEAVTGNVSSVRVGERLVAERLAALRP